MTFMKKMTREDVERYRNGWATVKALETEEAKLKSHEERWRELNMLFNFAYEFGLIRHPDEAELAPIQARWMRLRAAYL
jgi:hypothetical protein